MPNVFETIDKKGRKVVLTLENWNHILRHKGMEQHLENIKKALSNPTTHHSHKHNLNKVNYYLYLKETKRYLLVSVKYLNNQGDVRTAFITKKIMKK